MFERADIFGRKIVVELTDDSETYSRDDGLVVRFPRPTGWNRALSVFNSSIPGLGGDVAAPAAGSPIDP